MDEPKDIHPLIDMILDGEHPYSNRAARVLAICCSGFPEFFNSHQNRIIQGLQKSNSAGIIRNLLKIAADCPVKLSGRNRGILLGLCFDWLTDASRPVAIRVHSMQVIYNSSLHEPDIREELISILEDGYAEGTPGFRSRADRILRKLYCAEKLPIKGRSERLP